MVKQAQGDPHDMGGVYSMASGISVPSANAFQRAGERGPILLQDAHLIELLSHFNRERIPERVVHAKGSGAHGTFTCTEDISDICMTELFTKKGNSCPLTIRFSTVGGESGSTDAARDSRGFSIKLKTQEGNMDWVFLNSPVFFIRDPTKFVFINHVAKRDPRSHLGLADDSTMFWDFFGTNPEAAHQFTYIFGSRGIPKSWRHLNGYSCHTYKMYNKKGEWVFAQVHFKSAQGVEGLTEEEAAKVSPDHAQRDLFENIEKGNFPKWKVGVQTMTEEQAEKSGINVLDMTKTWPYNKYPIRWFGEMELNENPCNYFAEVEQSAFSPANMVPGFASSADPVLQARLFAYADAARYRVGANWQQLPVNKAMVQYPYMNFARDGAHAVDNQGARPNYPSSLYPLEYKPDPVPYTKLYSKHESEAVMCLSEISDNDFIGPKTLYTKVFTDEERQRFIKDVSNSMNKVRKDCKEHVFTRALAVWKRVDETLAQQISQKLNLD